MNKHKRLGFIALTFAPVALMLALVLPSQLAIVLWAVALIAFIVSAYFFISANKASQFNVATQFCMTVSLVLQGHRFVCRLRQRNMLKQSLYWRLLPDCDVISVDCLVNIPQVILLLDSDPRGTLNVIVSVMIFNAIRFHSPHLTELTCLRCILANCFLGQAVFISSFVKSACQRVFSFLISVNQST